MGMSCWEKKKSGGGRGGIGKGRWDERRNPKTRARDVICTQIMRHNPHIKTRDKTHSWIRNPDHWGKTHYLVPFFFLFFPFFGPPPPVRISLKSSFFPPVFSLGKKKRGLSHDIFFTLSPLYSSSTKSPHLPISHFPFPNLHVSLITIFANCPSIRGQRQDSRLEIARFLRVGKTSTDF